MRWENENWQNLQYKPVRLNTLAAGLTAGLHLTRSRVGVVLATNPKINGEIQLKIAYRNGRRWHEDYFTAKAMLDVPTNRMALPVLTGSLKDRVMRSWQKKGAATAFKGIGKGFSGNLGADPEIFAVVNDRVLPAWEFLPEKGPKNQIFWDGFQAEFTTSTETCLAWFIDHVRTGLVRIHKAAQPKGGTLALADVIEVPMDILEKAADEHVRFGCDPSKNAYNDFGQLEAKPRELEIRFAGGHKHFGAGELTDKEAIPIVKALDAIWGVASVSMFEGLEHPLRRAYYGKAGEYRLPKHGLEYRTPSNAWLCHPAIAQLSWCLARQAYWIGNNNQLGVWDADETEVRRVINELDVAGARLILKRNQVALKSLLHGYFDENNTRLGHEAYAKLSPLAVKYGLQVILKGALTVLEAPKDLVRNWMLDSPTDTDRWDNPTSDEERKENRWRLHTESHNKQWALAAGSIERGERI